MDRDWVGVSHRVRVLWLAKGLSPGGAEKLLVSMARVVDRSRFDYEVGYVLATHDEFVPALAELNVPSHCLDGRNEFDIRWIFRLRRLLVAGRYDVVHTHFPYVAGVARLVARTLPARRRPALVTTEHNVWPSYVWPTRMLNALTFGLDQHSFAVSREVRRYIWPVYRDRVEVLVQGIVTADVPPTERTGALRRELGIGPEDVLLVTVANMRPAKDYPGLLRAVRMLLDDGHLVRLAAAGGGPLIGQITALCDQLELAGKVHLLGYRGDVFTLLRDSDIFVMASLWEGYPITVMEAMVSGCAVVATAVGGVPDAIRSGVDGLLVEPGHPRELADAIATLITEPDRRRALSHAARERSTMFDISRATSRTEEVYAAVAQAGGFSCHRGDIMNDLKADSPKSYLLRLTKRGLTVLGSRLPISVIRALRLSVNYVHLGHWVHAHGFDTSTRVIDRTAVFDAVAQSVVDKKVLYLEYGVYQGASLRYWSSALSNPSAQLHAFDSFVGLPETFDSLTHPMGLFDVGGTPPKIDDSRIVYHIGWFEQTVPIFDVPAHEQLVVTLDADLYSSTKLVLDHLRSHIKPGAILYFDDMSRPEHEPAAFSDYLKESRQVFELVAVDETLNCAAFRCIG